MSTSVDGQHPVLIEREGSHLSQYFTNLGFQKTEKPPEGFRDELKNISGALSERTKAASLFRDFFGDYGLREIANAWRRQRTELDTWIFDYRWRKPSRYRRGEATTVFYFRSKLIHFPTLVAMPGAFIKWPEFVINLFPVLDKPNLFPSHPKLRYTCDFYGDEQKSHKALLNEDVLSFLENRLQPQSGVTFARALPPGFETCRNRLAVYRTCALVSPDRIEENLREAEELLKTLTVAISGR